MKITSEQIKRELIAASKLIDCGDYLAALNKLMLLEKVAPPIANIRWLIGHVNTRMNDSTQAIANYTLAYRLNPQLPYLEFKDNEIEFQISDVLGSDACVLFLKELYEDSYGLKELNFGSQDIAIDIGANVGFVSIYLAKKYPNLKILAFEPCKNTYHVLRENLSKNKIENVETFNFAVSGNGRNLSLLKAPNNSGMANAFLTEKLKKKALNKYNFTIEETRSKTLDSIFRENKINHCSFLKLDCEGAEFEIIENTKVLDKIDNIAVELHIQDSESIKNTSSKDISDDFWKLINESTPSPPNLRVSSIVHVAVE